MKSIHETQFSDVAEVAEWVAWINEEISAENILEQPAEEQSVLVASRACRLANRVTRIWRHVPRRAKLLLIEAAIVDQFWSRERDLRARGKSMALYRSRHLPVVQAVKHLYRMDGAGQHHLVQASDGHRYVIKFLNNPQSNTLLATEMLCTELARLMSLRVPPTAIVEVTRDFVRENKALRMDLGERRVLCEPGPCFGSRYIEAGTQTVAGSVPSEVKGSGSWAQFMGALVLDIWTLNASRRQALFVFNPRRGRFEPTFIDEGNCLLGGNWRRFILAPETEPVFKQWIATRVTQFRSLSRWLDIADHVELRKIWDIAFELPSSWYQGDRILLVRVLEKLQTRQWKSRAIVHKLIQASYFSGWKGKVLQPAEPSGGGQDQGPLHG